MNFKLLSNANIIHGFSKLANYLMKEDDELTEIITKAANQNGWFTPENIKFALHAIAKSIKEENIRSWLTLYPEKEKKSTTIFNIGLVLAGNIPAVGLHDVLCVLASGKHALIKLSSQDQVLIPFILKKLAQFEPIFFERFNTLDRLINLMQSLQLAAITVPVTLIIILANTPISYVKTALQLQCLMGLKALKS